MSEQTGQIEEEDSSWLRNLQKNSWEPEVIISGISLAFIFAFPAEVYKFAIVLVQDIGLDFIGAWLVFIYLSIIVNVFKIFFTVHLILRFAWTGLLGLSYAFPKGVINENLFKIGKDYEYAKPSDMVLKLERICSMAFAFPLMMGIVFLIFTSYLGFLLAIYKIFDLDFFLIYLIFMASLIGFSLFSVIGKKSKLKAWMAKSLFSTIQALYQSNLGKWYIMGYTIFIFLLTVPFIISDSKDLFLFSNISNLSERSLDWPYQSWHFEDKIDKQERFPRAMLKSEEIKEDLTPITLSYYEMDSKNLKILQEKFKSDLDSLGWGTLNSDIDLYRFYLNDSLVFIEESKWRKIAMIDTRQRAYQGLLDISHLENGVHEIRIEKIFVVGGLPFMDDLFRYRKEWDKFTFFKSK
jgi:hypothetical protein